MRNAWSQIDVQLKRRHDLIPNIVASIKGYMVHERGLFDTIVRAREKAVAAGSNVPARAAAEAVLDRSLHSIFALAESTPELKASTNMLALQEELSSTENRIAFARQHYNDAVLAYNTALATVPSVFIARAFAFNLIPLRGLRRCGARTSDRQLLTSYCSAELGSRVLGRAACGSALMSAVRRSKQLPWLDRATSRLASAWPPSRGD